MLESLDTQRICLQCAVQLQRVVAAVMQYSHGDGNTTGMCGNHAEVLSLQDLERCEEYFAAHLDEFMKMVPIYEFCSQNKEGDKGE